MTAAESEIQVIYVGVRLLKTGKLGDAFVLHGAPENAASIFERGRSAPHRVVGGIYRTSGTLQEDGTINTLKTVGGSFLGRWSGDPKLVMEWEAMDNAARTRDREQKLVERLRKEPKVAQEMRTLCAVYHRTPFADRTAFELMVLNALRRMPS